MNAIGVRGDDRWRRHADAAWLVDWKPAPFELRGGTTQVVAMGAGEPLLLLPPLPGYKEAFAPVAHRLARHHRVVTYDLRERFDPEAGWDVMLEDLERVAAAFAPRGAAVLGHSLGGALALHWALARPDAVRALVLSSAFARVGTPRGTRFKRFVEQPLVLAAQRWLPERAAAAHAQRLAARSGWVYDPRCDARTLALVREAIRATPIALAARTVRLALRHDVRARLGAIACPTLVISGAIESAFAREAAQELAAGIPGAVRRESPGAGHLHPLSNAAWLADSVGEWLGAAGPRPL